MPIYEYQCAACMKKLEVIQSYSAAPTTVCPECGGSMRKLISSPAIQFKGSGFYITDYGKAGSSKESGGSETSSTSGAESKAASSKGDAGSSSAAAPAATATKAGSSSD